MDRKPIGFWVFQTHGRVPAAAIILIFMPSLLFEMVMAMTEDIIKGFMRLLHLK